MSTRITLTRTFLCLYSLVTRTRLRSLGRWGFTMKSLISSFSIFHHHSGLNKHRIFEHLFWRVLHAKEACNKEEWLPHIKLLESDTSSISHLDYHIISKWPNSEVSISRGLARGLLEICSSRLKSCSRDSKLFPLSCAALTFKLESDSTFRQPLQHEYFPTTIVI